MGKSKSKIKLRGGDSIGAPAAEEDDNYLKECFVNLPLIDALKDTRTSKCLVLGRTGAGKSAILWHIENTLEEVSRIDPTEVAFQHVSNSTIIRHLTELGVDLHVFYQYLWKHLLSVHIIRDCLDVRADNGFINLVQQKISAWAGDQDKLLIAKYLEERGDSFWNNAEQISSEITETMTDSLSAAAGMSPAIFTAKLEEGHGWQEEEKRTFKCRATEIVSTLQMRELGAVIKAIANTMRAQGKSFYVLIDDLDARWGGDPRTQYALIRALIESIRSFRKIRNLKIVTSIREDLYESTLRTTEDRHFQPEKFDGLIGRLRWSEAQLHQLVEHRINLLFRQAYTKQGVQLEHVFPSNVREEKIRSFLVDRTLRRPRDVIALVNQILASNEGAELPLSQRLVSAAEAEYSVERLRALVREWSSCHPLLQTYLSVLARCGGVFDFADLNEDCLAELVVEVAELQREPCDDVEKLARQVYELVESTKMTELRKQEKLRKLAQALVSCLFKVGAIDLKLHSETRFISCFGKQTTIQEAAISDETRIRIQPMLFSALGGKRRLKEAA